MTAYSTFATRAAGRTDIVTLERSALPAPDADFFEEARAADLTLAEHDRLSKRLAALAAIEVKRLDADLPVRRAVTVAAWNAERLKYHAPSVDLVKACGADILLLTETDLGMARAGNRHTTADLASELGMSYVYGVEFVELGLGDSRERAWHEGETNAIGFHGNALLTRLPLKEVALIRLDDGAVWWTDAQDGQGRLGGRMALAACLETPFGPIIAVSVHLESKSDADDRARQITRLIAAVDCLAGDRPVVIGGDLNTNRVPEGSRRPEDHEPLFSVLATAGFTWESANDFALSQRTRPDGTPLPPFARIDWMAVRGLTASEPQTVPAVDGKGDAISDHELIVTRIQP